LVRLKITGFRQRRLYTVLALVELSDIISAQSLFLASSDYARSLENNGCCSPSSMPLRTTSSPEQSVHKKVVQTNRVHHSLGNRFGRSQPKFTVTRAEKSTSMVGMDKASRNLRSPNFKDCLHLSLLLNYTSEIVKKWDLWLYGSTFSLSLLFFFFFLCLSLALVALRRVAVAIHLPSLLT